ncbi:MAG: cupin domain-containing protein [Anaerolineales bacterium]
MAEVSAVESGVFPKGEQVVSDSFIGAVWLQPLVADDGVFDVVISNVTFAPGARNKWHKHPGGQILLVTGGVGCYQERGKPIQQLKPGDVVKIAPDVEHWHGASPDSWFSHLAISTRVSQGVVQWLGPVTDEEYKASDD